MSNESSAQFKAEVSQDHILHLELGDITHDMLADLKAWADKVRRMIISVYNRTGEKVLSIVDVTNLKKYDSQAFLILTDLMKDNEQYISKTATFGGTENIIAAQDILLALTGRKDFRAFETKEEALAWLASSK